MATDKLPNTVLRERDGAIRPRFQPGPHARRFFPKGQDLRHPVAGETMTPDAIAAWAAERPRPDAPERTGRWFTRDEVAAFCRARQAVLAASYADGSRPALAAKARPRTVAALLDDWLKALERSPDTRTATLASYRKAADAIRYEPETRAAAKVRRAKERAAELLGVAIAPRAGEDFAAEPVAAIGKPELLAFFEYLRRERGHHMALAAIAAFSAAWTWGTTSTTWRLGANPRHGLELPRPDGRIVIYTDAEIRALVAAADASGRASAGDAILLGLFTGQRQNDRLALADAGMVDGRRQFRQSKTGALVAVPQTPQLAARLEAAYARVSRIMLRHGLRERPAEIVVDERTGRGYVGDTYRHVFADVRELAWRGSNALGLAPCPSLFDAETETLKRDQDLRDTNVTWLARAGATVPMICAISGHSPRSVYDILKHYLAITPELADAAIAKLVDWMAREGMAV